MLSDREIIAGMLSVASKNEITRPKDLSALFSMLTDESLELSACMEQDSFKALPRGMQKAYKSLDESLTDVLASIVLLAKTAEKYRETQNNGS